MADNTEMNPGAGGDKLRTEAITGQDYKVQVVKVGFGEEHALTDVSAANPLPVALPTGASTAGNQATIIAALTAIAGLVDGVETLLGLLATAAGQTTLIGHVDGLETSASSIDGKLTSGVAVSTLPALAAGTNAIGKLVANAGTTIGAVEIAASQTVGLAAGSAAIGKLVANSGVTIGAVEPASGSIFPVARVLDVVYIGGTAYTVKHFAVALALNNAAGDLLAAVTGPDKKIRVLGFALNVAATVGIEWRSNTTAIVPSSNMSANGWHAPPIPEGGHWCETVAGQPLKIFTGGNTTVTVVGSYIEV